MRQNIYYFSGRGQAAYNPDDYKFLSCSEGTVFAIIHTSHETDFVYGYCRRAHTDRWGVRCVDPFIRGSDATLRESFAVPMDREQFISSPAKLELVVEQDWMRRQIS